MQLSDRSRHGRVGFQLSLTMCLILIGVSTRVVAGAPMTVWFDRPGRSFHESSLVGNGRLGAMDYGGVDRDRIVLNESSMWSGGSYEANKDDAYQCLPEVRAKLFAGQIDEAGALLNRSFRYAAGVKGWGDENQFGCYQILGDLTLTFDAGPGLRITSPSGHAEGDGKTIDGCVDGNTLYPQRRDHYARAGGIEAGRSDRRVRQGEPVRGTHLHRHVVAAEERRHAYRRSNAGAGRAVAVPQAGRRGGGRALLGIARRAGAGGNGVCPGREAED